jgi:hypothetical protein
MSFFMKMLGLSDADKKQGLVKNQMSKLEQYIADNRVEIVQNDPNKPFVKCGDIDKEHTVWREMDTQLGLNPNDPGLKAKRETLLRKEFFLKVGDQDKFVSLGNAYYLDLVKSNISTIIGLDPTSRDYNQQGNQFMNNYLHSRNATTTVDPEKDETNTLLKTFLRAAEKRKVERKAKEDEAYSLSQRKQRYNKWQYENDYNYALRMGRIEEERKRQDLIDPKNCSVNFGKYLETKVDEISGIGAQHKGKTIYDFLVASLGSTEGGFDKRFRNQTNMSGYDISYRQQMARYALQPDVQQRFIDALCKSEFALEILGTAYREDIGGGQSYNQTSQGDDIYTFNVWRALRLCLECLEEYILKEYMPQLPNVAIEQSPPPPPPPPSAAPLVVGGKLKSRSKSIRKKRISHRKKKSHSHKRRALKRRAVN